MLSTVPVHFPVFQGGFTPWDYQEPPLIFPHQDDQMVVSPSQEQEPVIIPSQAQEPIISNSGSDNSNPIPVNSSSRSDEPNRKHESSNSGSDSTNRETSVINERKRRRMMSNRESARRSRMRKQKHLENTRSQVNGLRIGNRELMNRLRWVTHRCHLVQSDNERLRSESNILRQRLWDIRQVLYVRELQQQLCSSAWPCNNIITYINEDQTQFNNLN